MKKFITFIMIAFVAIAVNAQNFSNYDGETKFTDNWSLGVEGGVQTNLHDWNAPQGAVWGLNLNKDLTKTFGLSLEGLAGVNNTANWLYKPGHFHNQNAIDNVAVYLTGRWNVLNSIMGYNGTRKFFEIETNVGVGYEHFFNHSSIAEDDDALLVKTGLNFNFNLGKQRQWTIALKPAVIWNVSATGMLDSRYAVGQLTAGLTYHFKTSNGTHSIAATPVPALVSKVDELNAEVNALRQQLADAHANVRTVEKVVEVVKTMPVESTYLVTFAQNKAVLTDAANANLDRIPADATVVLDAFASPEGTKTYNVQLSERRAAVVAKYLEERGVKVIKQNALGANTDEANRIVIVTVQ